MSTRRCQLIWHYYVAIVVVVVFVVLLWRKRIEQKMPIRPIYWAADRRINFIAIQ